MHSWKLRQWHMLRDALIDRRWQRFFFFLYWNRSRLILVLGTRPQLTRLKFKRWILYWINKMSKFGRISVSRNCIISSKLYLDCYYSVLSVCLCSRLLWHNGKATTLLLQHFCNECVIFTFNVGESEMSIQNQPKWLKIYIPFAFYTCTGKEQC